MDDLAGRDDELKTLTSLLGDALVGRGRAVVVLGEAGIGKSRLVETFAGDAGRRGFRVASGWCPDAEAPPYWPWRQALRALLGEAAGSVFDVGGGGREALFAAVVDGLEQATAQAPAMVVMEDVHWGDASSLALLRFVVGAHRGLPIVLVLTARDDPSELNNEAAAMLAGLPAAVLRLPLAGLDREATGAVVQSVLGQEPSVAFVDHLLARTGGNPFFVIEVARLHRSQGASSSFAVPSGVRQVLGRRLARLTQPTYELLSAAAVVEELDVELLAELTGRSESDLLVSLGEADRAHLVTSAGSGYVFAHALVRETLYEEQSPASRSALHGRVAELLEARVVGAEGASEATAGRVAAHWVRAVGSDAREKASATALVAAHDAVARMAYEQAVRYYHWALERAADPLPVLIGLGEAQVLAGELGTGRGTLARAADEARQQGRAEDLARAVLALGTGIGGFEVDVGDEGQVRLLEEALAALPAGESSLRAAVMARLSVALGLRVEVLPRRTALARQAVEMGRRAGDARVEVSALAAYCDAVAGPDDVGERLTGADRMIEVAGAIDDPALLLLGRRFRLMALLERGELAEVDAEIDAYARNTARLPVALYTWPVPIWRGMRALMEGDVNGAWRSSEEAEAQGRRAQSVNADVMVFTLRLAIARVQGTDHELISGFERILAQSRGYPVVEISAAAFFARAGEPERARRLLARRLAAGPEAVPRDAEWLEAFWFLGEAGMLLDEPEAVRLAYEALTPYAELWVVDGIGGACYGIAAHQVGRLAHRLGHHEEAHQHLALALERHRAGGATLLARQTEEALAEVTNLPHAGGPSVPLPAEAAFGEAEFRREGAVWRLRFKGPSATVPDSKGMRDLATLVARPGVEFHVLDLVEAAGGPPARATDAEADTGAVLDAGARAAYRRRLAELEDEIALAEAHADLGRLMARREEREFLARELSQALGLGGRARVAGDRVERSRKAVGMRIATALRAIEAVHPGLARHLHLAVSTGRFCAYRPEDPITWRS